jgi:protein-S-isoprenylcysteine O-methyltransferase Ste14
MAIGISLLVACFFGSAGTFRWPEAWLFITGYFLFAACILAWLKKTNPALLRLRMTMMKKTAPPWDKKITFFGCPFYIAMLIVPGLDAVRHQWSHVPMIVEVFAFGITALSLAVFVLVLKENSYLSRIVEIQNDHKVVSTGPYAFIRHPMYAAVIAMTVSLPLSLGSVWGLIPALGIVALILVRTHLEDRMLQKELGGYKEYAEKVRYHITPGIW